MASGKSSKSELVAIYRLEFYRKQKNWKFSSDKKKKEISNKHKKSKPSLNETYKVEGPSNLCGDIGKHNEAFIESLDEKNIPAIPEKLVDQKSFPNQHFDRSQNIQNTDANKSQTNTNQRIKNAKNYPILDPKLRELFMNEEPIWLQRSMPDIQDQTSTVQENFQLSSQFSDQSRLCHSCTQSLNMANGMKWSDACDAWSNQWQMPCSPDAQCVNPWSNALNDCTTDAATPLDVVDGEDAFDNLELVCVSEELLDEQWSLHQGQWGLGNNLQESEPNMSSDSLTDFMRGAHAAPHSSEIELRDLREGGQSAQLAMHVRRHANALRQLLCSASGRHIDQQILSATPLNNSKNLGTDLNSYADLPTHDFIPNLNSSQRKPTPVNRQNTFTMTRDVVLAGSGFRVGRGRGRLLG